MVFQALRKCKLHRMNIRRLWNQSNFLFSMYFIRKKNDVYKTSKILIYNKIDKTLIKIDTIKFVLKINFTK